MDENRTLLVGLDLGKKVTQLSYFDFQTFEPVQIERETDGGKTAEIPTALAVDPTNGAWYWIDEKGAKRENVIGFRYLLNDVLQGDTITVGKFCVDSYVALKRFIVKVLSLLKEVFPSLTIAKLVITTQEKNEKLSGYLRKICAEIGIPGEALVIQSYRQSYMYYAVSQPKELWINNVGLFFLEDNNLIYYRIDIDRKSTPYIVGISERDLTGGIDWEELEAEGEQEISYAFLNAANTVLYRKLVTTIYVTGDGFAGDWANEALRKLCAGRRVFRGQNLYTRGACYAARELSGNGKLKDCLLLDDDMVPGNISLRLYADADIQEVFVVKAGTVWSEVDESVDVIPDNEKELQVTVQNVLKHESKTHMLSLSDFEDRGNKMTRFTVRIRFADRDTCIITLKDNGFGEFCPSSNRVWERYISV